MRAFPPALRAFQNQGCSKSREPGPLYAPSKGPFAMRGAQLPRPVPRDNAGVLLRYCALLSRIGRDLDANIM